MTMKQIILFIALLASTTLGAQTYYWVGGTGDWSDLSHWATTSGGSTFHTQLPGESNDVRFDANSFTGVQQIVTLDQDLQKCRNLDATGVMFNPKIQGLVYTDDLEVYGDFILPATMQRNLMTIVMLGSGTHTISLNGEYSGGLSFIRLQGSGNYVLGSDFQAANLYIYCDGGSFNSMGYDVICNTRVSTYFNYDVDIDFSGSDIDTGQWILTDNNTYDLSNTTLTLGSALYLEVNAPGIYHPVVYVNGATGFTGDFTCGTFEVAPGSELQLNSGITINADTFTLNGTNGGAIAIHTNAPGSEATFSQTSGIVDGNYLILTDIHATGGAIFNASESIDNGNNDGWNFLVDTADNYYWVGGTGDANDLSHWATTSGGNIFHTAAPGLNDPIIFDANSFSSVDDIVTIFGNVTAYSIDATGALAGATIETEPGLNNTVTVLEGFNAGDLEWNLTELNLNNTAPLVFYAGSGNMNGTNIYITGGSLVEFDGDLHCSNLELVFGVLVASDLDIIIDNSFRFSGVSSSGDISGSNITCGVLFVETSIQSLDASNTQITCDVLFNGGSGIAYHNILLFGDVNIAGNFSCDELTIAEGSSVHMYGGTQVTLNNLVAVGTASNMITIDSANSGEFGTFYKESGLVEVYYADITDNHATGGAVFNALQSNDGGNTNGWNFIVGVEEAEATSLEAWPNPSNGQFQVATQGYEGHTIYVYDMCGKQITNSLITTTTFNLDLTQEESGTYLLVVDNNGQLVRQLLIKE
jgi:hypothetical protein